MSTTRLLRVAMLAVVLAACAGPSAPDDAPNDATTETAPTASSGTSDPKSGTITIGDRSAIRREVVGRPHWLAADDQWVYVKRDAASIDRLDPDTAEIVDSIELGGAVCEGFGAGFGSLWACADDGIVRVDFDTGTTEQIRLDKAFEQGHLATGGQRVWVLTGDGSTLVGIDPTTNEVGPPLALGVPGAELAFGADRVWVVSPLSDTVVEVDGAGQQVLNSIPGIDDPWTISATDSAVWVGALDETVRIDPATSEIVARVPGGSGRYGSIHASDRGVWVRSSDRFLDLIDPGLDSVVEELTYPDVAGGGDVLVAHRAVWASAFDDAAVVRVSLD